jgi:hypothetical protein
MLEVLEARTLPSFVAAPSLPTGFNPRNVIRADLTGHSRSDLVTANSGGQNVSVLLSNGDGTFQPARNYTVGDNPTNLVAADFRHSGILDLAVVTGIDAGLVHILLGNGDGTFRDGGDFAAGPFASGIAAGDFDRDGKIDLVVTNFTTGVSLLRGNGDGTFQAPVSISTGHSSVASVVAADFRHIGILDLALTSSTSSGLGVVTILLGNGDGTFHAPVDYSTGGQFPSALTAADLEQRGVLDLVATNRVSNNVSVFLGNGDGTFGSAVTYQTDTSPESVTVADFDGDGNPDLAVAEPNSGTVELFLGNGDGTFQSPTDISAGSGPISVTTGEFDGDNMPDLAAADSSGSGVVVLRNLGGGTFLTAPRYAEGTRPQGLVSADFRHTGILDLAIGNPDSTVSVLLGNGDGTFQDATRFSVGGSAVSLAAGDFNRDGNLDLAVLCVAGGGETGPTYEVDLLLGDGTGSFQTGPTFDIGESASSLIAADLRHNGTMDLVVAHTPGFSAGSLLVYLGNGDGTFQTPVRYNVGIGPAHMVAADLRHNGRLDLAVANGGAQTDTLSVLLSNGDGTFQNALVGQAGPFPRALSVGDFNHDGNLDLATDSNVLLGRGDGTFGNPVMYNTGGSAVAVGNFDSTGMLGLAVTTPAGVSLFRGVGDGTFVATQRYAAGTNPIALVTGDFNGDGRADLAVANNGRSLGASSGSVSVLLQSPGMAPGGGSRDRFLPADIVEALRAGIQHSRRRSPSEGSYPDPEGF